MRVSVSRWRVRWAHATAAVVVAVCLFGATVPARSADETADRRELPADVWLQEFKRPVIAEPGTAEARARLALGLKLFNDPRLSVDNAWSCATCHAGPTLTDGRPRARGRSGPLQRNTPTLLGIGEAELFNWDGSASSLAEQFERPITSADEMGATWPGLIAKLERDDDDRARFATAFPGSGRIDRGTITQALATAVRSFAPPRTAFDRWIDGDPTAISETARDGFRIFTGKGNCATCHRGWRFTDDKFHDVGLPGNDPGRGAVAGGVPGLKAFKTPTLRQVAKTAPYMHDGSKASLADVIAHYAGGFERRGSIATNVRRDLTLKPRERAALQAFLETL